MPYFQILSFKQVNTASKVLSGLDTKLPTAKLTEVDAPMDEGNLGEIKKNLFFGR